MSSVESSAKENRPIKTQWKTSENAQGKKYFPKISVDMHK